VRVINRAIIFIFMKKYSLFKLIEFVKIFNYLINSDYHNKVKFESCYLFFTVI